LSQSLTRRAIEMISNSKKIRKNSIILKIETIAFWAIDDTANSLLSY